MEYGSRTAYSLTQITEDKYLDVMVNKSIPKLASDIEMTINATYQYRPDLLSYDLYGHSDLWWVFAMRNPDILINPLLDFKVGNKILIPKLTTLQEVLGF